MIKFNVLRRCRHRHWMNRRNSGPQRREQNISSMLVLFFLVLTFIFFAKPRTTLFEEELNFPITAGIHNGIRTKYSKSLREALNLPALSKFPIQRPMIIGHRGAIYEELENTMAGFQKCLDMGCDAIELDVFKLHDGTLVVFHGGGTDDHPGDLSHYCIGRNGTSILDLEYHETQELQFNPNYPDFGCDANAIRRGRIPTLEEVLVAVKESFPSATVKMELKGEGTVQPTLELVEELGMVDQCQFSSFVLSRLDELRMSRPETMEDGTYRYKTGALFNHVPDNFLELAQDVGASEIHLRYDTCTVDRIQSIHSRNMKSMAWFRGPMKMKYDVLNKWHDVGNEDESMYLMVAETGVQQLCLNRPNVALKMWNNWPNHN